MAITLDGTNTQSAIETGVSTLTFSRTTGSGSNKGLVVSVSCYGANRETSGVTYAGSAMTEFRQEDGENTNTSVWFLPNPATGANNVVVTQPGNCDGISAGAVALFGVQQGTTADSSNGSAFSGITSKTLTVTTVAANCWIFDAIGDQTSALVQTSPQVLILDQFGHTGAGSYKTDVTAGSNSMAWTWGGSSESGSIAAAALAPAVVVNTTSGSTLLMMGV